MSPRREYSSSTALSTQVKANDERSILVEAGGFTPMRWFLEHAVQAGAHHGEPAQKRRRIIKEEESEPYCENEMSNQIPLFEISIDVHFPEALQSKSVKEKDLLDDVEFSDSVPVDIVPYRIETEHGETRLCITLPQDKSPILIVECTALPPRVLDLLLDIGVPERLHNATSRSQKSSFPASKLSCTLARSTGQLYTVVRLRASLTWQSGDSAFVAGVPVGQAKLYPDYDNLLRAFTDSSRDETDHTKPWTPRDFYESVQAPAKDEDTTDMYQNILQSELFPFQKRALTWMLKREGVKSSDGKTKPLSIDEQRSQGLTLFETREDINGAECSVNFLQGVVARHAGPDHSIKVSGGLLAEEMGLGKTVELLSLIALHTRQKPSEVEITDESGIPVLPSKATLIITPTSILQQWKSEINRHAPKLVVHHYEGVTSSHKKALSEQTLLHDLASKYDVVLTTYQTLAKEVHFAEDPPDRNMRHKRKFERKRSPLVRLQWWRICLDEAQMVESGVTAAARVACRLPRLHSWAVSGTPLRKNVQDLHGLLIFLRYWPFNENAKLWFHLITNHKHLFRQIFGQIALRHTKAQVRDDLRLPPQKRIVITVPFSVVEQQNYSTLFDAMCDEVGVNADGSPKSEDWDPQDSSTMESMRSWLVRLRQTCLHPQVGGRNRRALGRGQGPLRTVAEVLQVMIDQNETNLRVEERAVLMSSLLRAHVLGNNGEDLHRSEKAVDIYKIAMETSAVMLKEARERLVVAKTSQAEDGEKTADSSDEDSSSESTPVLGRLRHNVRTALQLHHVCTFFTATAYYQIKTNESLTIANSDGFKQLESRETELYEDAKILRKEILKDTSRKAELSMRRIKDLHDNNTFTGLPAIKDLEDMGGIESRRIIESSYQLFNTIRKQVKVINTWRASMAEFLVKPLVDEDQGIETTGDEYEDSTKQQDELYAYFDAFKAIQADLNSTVTGEAAPLIDYEAKNALRDAKWVLDPTIADDQKPFIHAPELTVKLLTQRNALRSRKDQVGSIRGLIQEARGLEGSMQWNDPTSRAAAEHTIIRKHLARLQSVFTSYSKALIGLEKEVDMFRATQNLRVEFYRQLQELSDAVAPYKEELDPSLDVQALQTAMQKEEAQNRTLAQLKTKHRFLMHLRDENGAQAGPRICVICQSAFESGVLTVCGHQYCKECIQHWFQQSKTCPVCKRRLHHVDIHEITYKPQEIRAQEEAPTGDNPLSQASDTKTSVTPSGQTSLYSGIDTTIMDEIKSIDLPTSYGTKIDTLGRHLHWIRDHDPGAKSIVFSQFREFLDVLGTALIEFKIGYSRLGRAGAVERFRSDPSIDCLLLDAKTDSSGLTLVAATHVFLCEPLLQTAVELQAIARVHRIGQTRPTTVWMYQIHDTVEEAIYELSVARRLAHVQSRSSVKAAAAPSLQEHTIDAANSDELQSTPLNKLLVAGKGGGEMVGNEDLWQCLFGKTPKSAPKLHVAVEREVGRHLRAEAAEMRKTETF